VNYEYMRVKRRMLNTDLNNVIYDTVAYRPVAKLWLCKQRPLLAYRFLRRANGPAETIFFLGGLRPWLRTHQ
jgi:hypothetical protein